MPGDPWAHRDDPEDPQDDGKDEAVAMKGSAPERDDRTVVILWYEEVLDLLEEVAKSLQTW